MIIKRNDYLDKIRPFIGKDLVKVLTGLRRSGKSVLLKQIQEEILSNGVPEENILYYNFEDFDNRNLLTSESLHEEIKKKTKDLTGKVYLFFDEIQEVDQWEKVINSLRLNPDFDLYITGSNAKLLSSDLTTYLAGRYVEFQVFPFTFSEFYKLYVQLFPDQSRNEVFNQYLRLGGMPYLTQLNYSYENSKQYLTDLFNSVFSKDILKRNKFRDVDLLDRIITFLISNNGQLFSANSVSKFLKSENRKVSVDTILNYVKACEEAFLVKPVKREIVNGKKNLKINEKIYLADHAFHNVLFGDKDINQTLETIVLNELLKRGFEVSVGKISDQEIDFIARKYNKKIYIQVSYLLASEDVIDREFSSLKKVKDNFPKYVLSMDQVDFSQDGIIHKNIVDFLLDENW